jgi:hypothetical protein
MFVVIDEAHKIAKSVKKGTGWAKDAQFTREADIAIKVLGLKGKKVDAVLPDVFMKMREFRPELCKVKDITLMRRYYRGKAPPRRSVRKKR